MTPIKGRKSGSGADPGRLVPANHAFMLLPRGNACAGKGFTVAVQVKAAKTAKTEVRNDDTGPVTQS